jgi:signal transduction histidine kinase
MPPSGQSLLAAYEQESRALCRQAVYATSWLALPLIAAFGVLESSGILAAPDFFPALRLGCGTTLSAVIWLASRPFGHRCPRGLFAVLMAAVGLMLVVMTIATGREESPYFAGIALLLLATSVLMPWPARWSAVGSVALTGVYALAMLLTGPIAISRMFYSNVSLLLAVGVIATASTAFREQLRWREFANRSALVDALQQRREFMAKMSHELRTPLHVIIGYADILLGEFLPAEGVEARGLVERSRTSAVSLHRMISDLLDYAKVEAGKMDVRAEPMDVSDVVAQVVDGFRPLIERKGLAVTVRCEDALPAVVSDRQRVEQILVNLIGNAVKFTEQGEVAIETCVIRGPLDGYRSLDGEGAEAAPGEAQLAILVRDTGVGIAEDDLARLAQDFQQVAEAAAGYYGGTGLGLSISRKLAQLLGGRIAVRSRHAEGSTFALLLPAPEPRHRAAA